MSNQTHARTLVYLEAAPSRAGEMRGYAAELAEVGFEVASTWHTRPPRLRADLIELARADLMIVWPSGTGPRTWLKIGYAGAIGHRIIAVNSGALPDPVLEAFFMLTVPTWAELARDQFLKLGSVRFRRET